MLGDYYYYGTRTIAVSRDSDRESRSSTRKSAAPCIRWTMRCLRLESSPSTCWFPTCSSPRHHQASHTQHVLFSCLVALANRIDVPSCVTMQALISVLTLPTNFYTYNGVVYSCKVGGVHCKTSIRGARRHVGATNQIRWSFLLTSSITRSGLQTVQCTWESYRFFSDFLWLQVEIV